MHLYIETPKRKLDKIYKLLYIKRNNSEMEVLKMGKTPEYTKKAVNNYRDKFDFIQVRFPKGTRERLEGKGNVNDYICGLVLSNLGEEQAEKEPEKSSTECPF